MILFEHPHKIFRYHIFNNIWLLSSMYDLFYHLTTYHMFKINLLNHPQS